MSHFTVLVRVPAQRIKERQQGVAPRLDVIPTLVEEMLAPFQENNMGDCPKQFLEFQDEEDDMLSDYNESEEHRAEYKTFEDFAREYHGYKTRDPEKNRYGSWENPNKKWDWWTIGGRWHGFFPIKPDVTPALGQPGAFGNEPDPGCADIVRVHEIDLDRIAQLTREKAEDFWTRFEELRATGKDPDKWGSTRTQALSLGLAAVIRDRQPTEDERPFSFSWETFISDPKDSRRAWFDVYMPTKRADFMASYIDAFNPISTYAALDEEGWHAPGDMGWFGCSSDTPDTKLAFVREFVKRFIKTAHPDDALVVVDCHI